MDRDVRSTLAKSDLHKSWIAGYRNSAADRLIADIIARAMRLAELPAGAQVLDAGCGSGTNTVRFAKAGWAVTGVDFSEFALQLADDAISAAGLSATLQRADLTTLPFPDAHFDGVFCIGVLMHIPQFKDALTELVRVLKPGGRLILSETNEHSLEMRAYNFYYKRISARGIRLEHYDYGTEAWSQTEAGPLVARRMNQGWLRSYLADLGLTVTHSFSGAYTELFRRFTGALPRTLLLALDKALFTLRAPSAWSTGVIVIARKKPEARRDGSP